MLGQRTSPSVPEVIRVRTEDNVFQRLEVLKRNRNKRHRFGEFVLEGVRGINAARAHGWGILALAYAADRRLSAWAQMVLTEQKTATHLELSPHLMEELSDREDSSELIAIVGIPDDNPDRIALGRAGAQALVVIFDRPVSPGNLGSIIRSCDALGADGLIVTGHGADVYDPATVRASAGSLFALPTIRLASHNEAGAWVDRVELDLGGTRPQIVGASGDGDFTIEEIDLTGATVLVTGNETKGLSAGYRAVCDTLVRIPMAGAADSLNVACAASIVLYEAARQRRRRVTVR